MNPISSATSPALSDVLNRAAQAWQLVRGGRSIDRALAATLEQRLELRPAVQDALYTAVRHLAVAQRIIARFALRPPPDDVTALLAVSLAQLLTDRRADYAVVDQAVRAAQQSPRMRASAGFVNGLLRNFLRQQDTVLAEERRDPAVLYNLPQWWLERLKAQHPDHWSVIAQAQQQMPPLVLRVNTARTSVDAYMAHLAAHGINATRVGSQAVWMHQPRPVSEVPAFKAGEVSVQDAGAQLAAQWLGASPGMQVLDACAAPGGKTTHLAELGVDRLTAVEVDAERAQRIRENLMRTVANPPVDVRVVVGDARQPRTWWSVDRDDAFDRILLDAPCTASGIVRRHPDVPWLRRPADVAQLTTLQAELLDALWPLLRVGGRLLYVVCSLFLEEGHQQIERFGKRHRDMRRLPLPVMQLLPTLITTATEAFAWHESTLPTLHDGFFYALLEKTG